MKFIIFIFLSLLFNHSFAQTPSATSSLKAAKLPTGIIPTLPYGEIYSATEQKKLFAEAKKSLLNEKKGNIQHDIINSLHNLNLSQDDFLFYSNEGLDLISFILDSSDLGNRFYMIMILSSYDHHRGSSVCELLCKKIFRLIDQEYSQIPNDPDFLVHYFSYLGNHLSRKINQDFLELYLKKNTPLSNVLVWISLSKWPTVGDYITPDGSGTRVKDLIQLRDIAAARVLQQLDSNDEELNILILRSMQSENWFEYAISLKAVAQKALPILDTTQNVKLKTSVINFFINHTKNIKQLLDEDQLKHLVSVTSQMASDPSGDYFVTSESKILLEFLRREAP